MLNENLDAGQPGGRERLGDALRHATATTFTTLLSLLTAA